MINLEGEQLSFQKFQSQVQTMALFATTRLVIIENIFAAPKETQEKIKEYLDKISGSTVVVFVSRGNPDKRLGLFKALNKPKQAQNFAELSENDLHKFVQQEIKTKNGKISREATNALLQSTGSDLWRLENEIDKLVLYADNREITEQDIELLVSKNIIGNIFTMVDNLSSGQRSTALKEVQYLLESGEPALRILAMINYQYRLIAQVKDSLNKAPNPFAISKLCGLSYFQVQKVYPLSQKISWKNLSKTYSKILRFDEEIKTGKIDSDGGLKELILNL